MTRQKFEGERTLMRIHIGESDKWHGKPLYDAREGSCHSLSRRQEMKCNGTPDTPSFFFELLTQNCQL